MDEVFHSKKKHELKKQNSKCYICTIFLLSLLNLVLNLVPVVKTLTLNNQPIRERIETYDHSDQAILTVMLTCKKLRV